MNLARLIQKYRNIGYNYIDATAQVCQDILLYKISNTKFGKNITIKGGVVMHNISGDKRRATRDLDLDFIKYSLANEYIYKFIDTLNTIDDNINIEITGEIEELRQQDYHGKRVFLKLTDEFGYNVTTKLDIGVEKNFDEEQEDFCFNLDVLGKNANLLINSPEQIFTEKLKSLLKLGLQSSRYKDLFDFYYLITENKLNKDKLYLCIAKIIYNDDNMRENNIGDIIKRLSTVFYSPRYKNNLTDPKVNWLDISVDDAIDLVMNYVKELDKISV